MKGSSQIYYNIHTHSVLPRSAHVHAHKHEHEHAKIAKKETISEIIYIKWTIPSQLASVNSIMDFCLLPNGRQHNKRHTHTQTCVLKAQYVA